MKKKSQLTYVVVLDSSEKELCDALVELISSRMLASVKSESVSEQSKCPSV